jgi:uncharacterized damage-inducible protein DinB
MTDTATIASEEQARRLESVNTAVGELLRRPEVAQRLRTAGGEEWSALQIVAHMTEMIPYWMHDARILAASTGEPPHFGRNLDAPERLDPVARGATSDPDELLRRLDAAIQAAAGDIRAMSPAERARTGIHNRRGAMTAAEVIEQLIVQHAEEHVGQIRQVLRLPQ